MKYNETKLGKGTNWNETKRRETKWKEMCILIKMANNKASKLDVKFLDWFGIFSLSWISFFFPAVAFFYISSFTGLRSSTWNIAIHNTIVLSYTIMKKLHSFLVEAVSPRNGLHWKWVNSPKQFIFIVHGQVFAFFSLIINLSIVLEVVIGHKTTLTVFLRACE